MCEDWVSTPNSDMIELLVWHMRMLHMATIKDLIASHDGGQLVIVFLS